MSQYVLIAGAVFEIIGGILVGSATAVTYIRGSQSTDPNQKNSLHVAGIFLGISLIFSLVSLVTGFILLSTKGCSKRNKIIFIIAFSLFLISYIIALVILYVFKTRLQSAGNTDEASALNSAFILPIIAFFMYVVGFILFYVVLGKKLRGIAKACKAVKKVRKRVKTEEQTIKTKEANFQQQQRERNTDSS
jgi:cellulose synthase/poly-beta-1,6-N-acetylglucosamine synthase-like glycosyltransferase